MIIVWGFKSYVEMLGIMLLTCSSCQTPAAHRLQRMVRKFTFFWIPLFPVKRQNLLTCTFCGTTVVVPEEQVFQLMAQAQQPAGPPAQPDPYPAQPNPYPAQPPQ